MPNFKRQGSKLWPELWSQWLDCFKGKAIVGVELGSWEGQSALWFLENILTNANARLVCVDTFGGNTPHKESGYDCSYLEQSFRENLFTYLDTGKVELRKGMSQVLLRQVPVAPTFDFAYVDGAHEARAVFEDLALVWPLLKPDAILLCDDYEWSWPGHGAVDTPRIAIDAFLQCYAPEVKLLHKGYQVIMQKKS